MKAKVALFVSSFLFAVAAFAQDNSRLTEMFAADEAQSLYAPATGDSHLGAAQKRPRPWAIQDDPDTLPNLASLDEKGI